MDKELTEKLWNDFPLLYSGKDQTIRTSLIPFGFECGPGWYKIIYELSEKLEKLIKQYLDGDNKKYCFNCYCEFEKHKLLHSGKKHCTSIFHMPIYYAKVYSACVKPDFKKELKYYGLLNGLKKYLKSCIKYNTFKFKHKINHLFHALIKFGIYKKQLCSCEDFVPYYPMASQVKEKFGRLHFYMTFATEEMWNLIEEAEELSTHVCEFCGDSGETRDTSWIRTLCDDCYKKVLESYVHK